MPEVMGGIETHCAQLLPRLQAQAPVGQLQITVLARRGYVDAAGRIDGVAQIPLWAPRHRFLETIVHTVYALFYARFVLHADGVHLHAIGPGLTAPLARLLGMRLLFTHHGEDYRRQKWGALSKRLLRWGEGLAVTFSHRVITVSAASAKRLQGRYPHKAAQITHIPNGLTPPRTPMVPRDLWTDLGIAPGQYLITVGRLVPEKAQDLLIKAYRRSGLTDRDPPCKLLIVGGADHDSAYAHGIVACASDTIVLPGPLPRDTIMALNRAAALFVLPSTHEGLSIAALEAIWAGAPIVLSDITANRDIGLAPHHYFETGSVVDLVRCLQQDFKGFIPRNFDASAFDWDQIAARTLEQLMAVMGADRQAPPRTDIQPHTEEKP